MADIVVTVPRGQWWAWLAEGDPAGAPWSGRTHRFVLRGSPRPPVSIGERLYVVAHGHVRGFAPVVAVERMATGWAIVREGEAEAVTLGAGPAPRPPIAGFPGWRERWWEQCDERPFPSWRDYGMTRRGDGGQGRLL